MSEHKKDDISAAILLREVFKTDQGAADPEELEHLLWCYAAQLLDTKEEHRIADIVASDPDIEYRLEHIRELLDASHNPSLAESLATARARIERMLEKAEGKFAEVGALIAKGAQGMTALRDCPGLEIAQPVMLGSEDDSSVPMGRRVDLPEERGLRLSLVYAPDGSSDLMIKAVEGPGQGEISLVSEAVAATDTERRIRTWMRSGRARIEACPSGLLRLEAPGGRVQRFYLYDLEEGLAKEGGASDV